MGIYLKGKKQREINARLCKKWNWTEWGIYILECRFCSLKPKYSLFGNNNYWNVI